MDFCDDDDDDDDCTSRPVTKYRCECSTSGQTDFGKLTCPLGGS